MIALISCLESDLNCYSRLTVASYEISDIGHVLQSSVENLQFYLSVLPILP